MTSCSASMGPMYKTIYCLGCLWAVDLSEAGGVV